MGEKLWADTAYKGVPTEGFAKHKTTLGDDYKKFLSWTYPTTAGLADELNRLFPKFVNDAKARVNFLVKKIQGLNWTVDKLSSEVKKAREELEKSNNMLHKLLLGELGSDPSSWDKGEEDKKVEPKS
jgi:hypothetical protein